MTKFIAIVSGKGGVGKTTTTINLGKALLNLDKKVLLLDANIVTPNLGIHLGLINPKNTLNQFLRKEKQLEEVTHQHESGLQIIPASPSYPEFKRTNLQHLTEVFEHLDDTLDFVLIDSPSGLGYEVDEVLKNSDEILLVVNPTLSSVMDALKTIQAAQDNDNFLIGVVLNMMHGKNELKAKEIEAILGHPILAQIKYDHKVRKALHQSTPLVHAYPRSRPAKEFKKVAEYLCQH